MQLLRITTTPSLIEFNIENAQLKFKADRGGFTLEKTGGSLEVNVSPARMSMNSDDFRSDMNLGPTSDTMAKFAQAGKQAASEATVRNVDFGNRMMNIQDGANIPDILLSRMIQDTGRNLVIVPLRPVNISWSVPQMSMNYTPVKQNFDWQIAKSVMEYVPGRFSINVKQYYSVNIEYVGKPNYVPPGSAPQ